MGRGKFDDDTLEAPADFDGPTSRRKCTDILFTLLIITAWAGMSIVGLYSMQNGDITKLIEPMDYAGNTCGKNEMFEYPKIVYVNNAFGGVCVKECPRVESLVDVHTLITYNGVYQSEDATLDPSFVEVADYSNTDDVQTCNKNTCPTDPQYSWFSFGVRAGFGYAYYAVDTFEIVGNRCIRNPVATTALDAIITTPNDVAPESSSTSNFKGFFQHLYGDIFEARFPIMIFGLVVSALIGLTYTSLLRIQPILTLMIWGSILATIGIILAMGLYTHTLAEDWRVADPQVMSDENINAAQICAYILFGISGLVILITLSLRRQIMLSMACIRAAGRALSDMPTMTIFPIIQVLGLASFMVVWIIYSVHLVSIGHTVEDEVQGDITIAGYNVTDFGNFTEFNGTSVRISSFQIDDFPEKCNWYLLFCFFWTTAFVSAIGQIIIAMCVARWYFTRDKRKVGVFTLFSCIAESLMYHIGTAAFGSFIIACIQMIRYILAKIQKKMRELDNKCGQAILCCLQCCMWCFEKCIKFLNKNAYIQTAIFGTPFCISAKNAFSLIVRNAGKIASISYVSAVVLFVGKIFICTATTFGGYVYIEEEYADHLYSAAGPCVLIFIISYFVGDMFLSIFDMTTSTILQCFVADDEMFDGDECYAGHELRRWVDDFAEAERNIVAGR